MNDACGVVFVASLHELGAGVGLCAEDCYFVDCFLNHHAVSIQEKSSEVKSLFDKVIHNLNPPFLKIDIETHSHSKVGGVCFNLHEVLVLEKWTICRLLKS